MTKTKMLAAFEVYALYLLTGALTVLGTGLMLLAEREGALRGMGAGERLLNAFFLSVTPRTAGSFCVSTIGSEPPSPVITAGLVVSVFCSELVDFPPSALSARLVLVSTFIAGTSSGPLS